MDGGGRGSSTVRRAGGAGVAIDFDSFLDGLTVGKTIIGRGAYGESQAHAKLCLAAAPPRS